jgi:hypothetical protein
MVRIHFISGKELEFEYDWIKLAPKFQHLGLRMFRTPGGQLVPANSPTIEYIEIEETAEEIIAKEIKVEESPVIEAPVEEPAEKKEQSAHEKAAEMLEEMKKLSSCPHEKYDYYYVNSTAGPNRKPVKRYFPVCANCGIREKFIKADSLTDEQKENAKVWVS